MNQSFGFRENAKEDAMRKVWIEAALNGARSRAGGT